MEWKKITKVLAHQRDIYVPQTNKYQNIPKLLTRPTIFIKNVIKL